MRSNQPLEKCVCVCVCVCERMREKEGCGGLWWRCDAMQYFLQGKEFSSERKTVPEQQN